VVRRVRGQANGIEHPREAETDETAIEVTEEAETPPKAGREGWLRVTDASPAFTTPRQ
jgi:hypothetical protein